MRNGAQAVSGNSPEIDQDDFAARPSQWRLADQPRGHRAGGGPARHRRATRPASSRKSSLVRWRARSTRRCSSDVAVPNCVTPCAQDRCQPGAMPAAPTSTATPRPRRIRPRRRAISGDDQRAPTASNAARGPQPRRANATSSNALNAAALPSATALRMNRDRPGTASEGSGHAEARTRRRSRAARPRG